MATIFFSHRWPVLRALAAVAAALLLLKVLVSILLEYRYYFPPNFELSAFLAGRQNTFVGTYRAAFYLHIAAGPVAIVLACYSMLSGTRPSHAALHRAAGKLQTMLVLFVIVPTGLVMAQQAYAGAIAALGFSLLAISTGLCVIAAAFNAVKGKFGSHRRWATRCFILLASPLLLRVISGAAIVLQVESEWIYRLNAWLSWLLPLVIYEAWLRLRAHTVVERTRRSTLGSWRFSSGILRRSQPQQFQAYMESGELWAPRLATRTLANMSESLSS